MNIHIDRTVPLEQQHWRRSLYLVSSLPSRFLGLLSDDEAAKAINGTTFRMSHVGVYYCDLQVQQTPRGIVMAPMPHLVTAYDLMTPLNSIQITHAQHIIRVCEQPEAFRDWMEGKYLDLFDPPKLVSAPR